MSLPITKHFMKRRGRRGYTAVEVLSAMTLFAIGAAGVIGMQRVTVQGGSDARRFDVATNIANEWMGRLQRDAAFWTSPNDIDRVNSNISSTKWLNDVTVATCSGNNYCLPTLPTTAVDSAAFDVLGRDMPKVGAGVTGNHFYCFQYRMNWVANPRATGQCPAGATEEPCITGLIRAEVRVFWARLEQTPVTNCETADLSDPNKYHWVYATTMIRQNSSYPDAGSL